MSEDKIYSDIQRLYDLTLDRRKILTSQATNLMGFAAIVDTILVSVLIMAATDIDVRTILKTSPFESVLLLFVIVGFLSYVLTSLLALLAYWEPTWIPGPQIPRIKGKKNIDSLKFFIDEPTKYNTKILALQLQLGVEYNQRINDKKYDYLRAGAILVLIGISCTALVGLLFLGMILT